MSSARVARVDQDDTELASLALIKITVMRKRLSGAIRHI